MPDIDCLTAQGLISDAVDRAPIDAATLAEAKAHCLHCPTCSVYVRTLLLVKNSPLPQPPPDLADRVMSAVRAEARQVEEQAALAAHATAAQLEVAAVAEAACVDAPAESGKNSDAIGSGSAASALRRWARSLSRQEMLTWSAAAVIFVAAIGLTAIAGVRVLTTDPTLTAGESAMTAARDTDSKSQQSAPAAESADTMAGIAATSAATSEVAPAAVTVNGVVYILSGPSSIATDGLQPVGPSMTALGTGATPTSHAAYSGSDPDRVYLADEANRQLLAFDRVVRAYEDKRYQLTSAEMSAFGQWATLPAQVPAPTADDGSPTFVVDASDASRPPVYRLASGSTADGIAIGPGSDPADPAGGNPNWTWWTPTP